MCVILCLSVSVSLEWACICLTVCIAWCLHHAVTAYSWLDSCIPLSFPFLCNEKWNYAVLVQYVLCAMYIEITRCVCIQNKCTFGWSMGFSGVRLMIFTFVFMCRNVCDSTVFTVRYTNFVLVYQNYFVKSKICIWLKISFLFLWCMLCFWSMAFPLLGFQEHWGFWVEDVIPMTNPQSGRSGYLYLSSSSLEACLAWVAIPAASLLSA